MAVKTLSRRSGRNAGGITHVCAGPSHAMASICDSGHMPALVSRRFDLQRGRHARAVGANDGGGAIGRDAVNVLDLHLPFERIRQADDDESEMQEHGVNDKIVASWPPCWLAVAVNTEPTFPISLSCAQRSAA